MRNYKTFAVSLGDQHIEWLKKTSKKVGMKSPAELNRVVIEDAMQKEPKELINKIVTAKVKASIEHAEKVIREAEQQKDQLLKQLTELKI